MLVTFAERSWHVHRKICDREVGETADKTWKQTNAMKRKHRRLGAVQPIPPGHNGSCPSLTGCHVMVLHFPCMESLGAGGLVSGRVLD